MGDGPSRSRAHVAAHPIAASAMAPARGPRPAGRPQEALGLGPGPLEVADEEVERGLAWWIVMLAAGSTGS
jgi:hypothetical protein